MSSLHNILKFREKPEVTGSEVWRVSGMLERCDLFLIQELLDTDGSMCRCVVVMQHPAFAFPAIAPDTSNSRDESFKDFLVEVLVDRGTLLHELLVNDDSVIEEDDQHRLDS